MEHQLPIVPAARRQAPAAQRLDPRTAERGRRGVADARDALREAAKRATERAAERSAA